MAKDGICGVDIELGDPDITGFGVLISFLGSILFVIIAMIWAYMTGRLPKECHNDFDKWLLGQERNSQKKNECQVHTFRVWMLAMSDQQLLSGLALAITINMIRNGVADMDLKVTGYAYNNAVILALFACMIHLATLGTLRSFLKVRNTLKHTRAALMLSMFVLILQGLAETWRELDAYVTLRCAVSQLHNYGYLDSLNTPTPDQEFLWGDISTVMGLTCVLSLLASGYGRRIYALYSSSPEKEKTLEQRLASWWARRRTTLLQAQEAEKNLALRGRTSKSFWNEFTCTILPNFYRSFIFEIIWTLTYFSMGLAQMSYYLIVDYDSSVSSRISFEPNFGQLLPLILLGLPILAMLEGYSDRKDQNGSDQNSSQECDRPLAAESSSSPGTSPAATCNAMSSSQTARKKPHMFQAPEGGPRSDDIESDTSFKARCWVFAIFYFTVCLWFSIALGDMWAASRLRRRRFMSYDLVVAAFCVSVAWVLVSLTAFYTHIWQMRNELRRLYPDDLEMLERGAQIHEQPNAPSSD